MGKTIISEYHCDVCKTKGKVVPTAISVIQTTEQTEGRSCSPYLDSRRLDLCDSCYKIVLSGKIPYSSGAMGYNEYRFQ